MSQHWKEPEPSLGGFVAKWQYYVRVCSFTFSFSSVEEIQEYLDYFSRKIHPTSADWAGNRRIYLNVGDHYDRQTCFDRLPLYLKEEPKRHKVAKALQKALAEFSE
jgi:hypothetical protein